MSLLATLQVPSKNLLNALDNIPWCLPKFDGDHSNKDSFKNLLWILEELVGDPKRTCYGPSMKVWQTHVERMVAKQLKTCKILTYKINLEFWS